MDATLDRSGAASLLASLGRPVVPVDVAAIAARCGIRICYRRDLPDKVAGFLYRGPLRDVIVVNAHHPRVRQRFTIAHEIGHWHLGEAGVSFKGIHRDCSSESERAADVLATELLMPERLVQAEWRRYRSVPTLARHFQVSRGAMIRRVREVGAVEYALSNCLTW